MLDRPLAPPARKNTVLLRPRTCEGLSGLVGTRELKMAMAAKTTVVMNAILGHIAENIVNNIVNKPLSKNIDADDGRVNNLKRIQRDIGRGRSSPAPFAMSFCHCILLVWFVFLFSFSFFLFVSLFVCPHSGNSRAEPQAIIRPFIGSSYFVGTYEVLCT
jgi:hypothetical protein